MNFIKLTIAATAAITCCIGQQMPARAYTTTCMDMGGGMTTCNGPGGQHTIMDMTPSRPSLLNDSLDPFDSRPSTGGMTTCSTFGSTTTCF